MKPRDESPGAANSGWHLIRDRGFGPYFVGSAVSSSGNWFQMLAASLLAYDLTGSTLMVGVVNFGFFAGTLVLASVAGVTADKFDRRRLLILSNVASAVVSAGLAAITMAGVVTPALLVAAMVLLGLCIAFMAPAMFALVPSLVPAEDHGTALALQSVTATIGRAIGPIAAAWVIVRAGYGAAFVVNSLTYLLFIGCLLIARRPRSDRGPRPLMRPRLRETIATVRQSANAPALFAIVSIVAMASDPVMTLMPEFALDVLGGSEATTGILTGAFGIGGIMMALFILPRLRSTRVLVLGLALLGSGLVALAAAPNVAVALIGLATAGAGFITAVARATTLIQASVPDSHLGRAMALWSVCFLGTRPAAALIDGAIAEATTPRVAAATMGLLALAAAAWTRSVVRPRVLARQGAVTPQPSVPEGE